MKYLFLLSTIFSLISIFTTAQDKGNSFAAKENFTESLPFFEESKSLLPEPVLETEPELIKMYWKCWEIAFEGFKKPSAGSPLVSNWLDEAFSENIFQWDTIFMMMFARYGHNVFPAIQSLDNFYAFQRESGYICREYREIDGKEIHYHDGDLFHPKGRKNSINPPLFAWAEVESFRLTGDKTRFESVLPILEKYAEWLNKDGDPDAIEWEENGRRSAGTPHRLFWNTPLGSGMDNTPRPTMKGAGWVEMSSQMVIMYNNLAIICAELGLHDKSTGYIAEAEEIANRINQWCWNKNDGFYYDVLENGSQFKKKTIGGFWPLLAEVASEEQAEQLLLHLKNPEEFYRPFLFPTLSADEEEYDKEGGYWLGSVWAPTNLMVIKGLEKYDFEDFATEATIKYLKGMEKVFSNTGTVWENYAPEYFMPGKPSRPDFVGWTGCGPIGLLIENVIGLRVDGVRSRLQWNLNRAGRHGIRNLQVGNVVVSLIYEPLQNDMERRYISVETTGSFELIIKNNDAIKTYNIVRGKSKIFIK